MELKREIGEIWQRTEHRIVSSRKTQKKVLACGSFFKWPRQTVVMHELPFVEAITIDYKHT